MVERDAALVDPGRSIPEAATAVHGITTERARVEGRPINEAIASIAEALCAASTAGTPVCGMKLDFDLTIVDAQCRRHLGAGLEDLGFAAPVLDALVIDRHADRWRKGRRTLVDLCEVYEISIERAHDAAADAEAAVSVLLAVCRRYPELRAQSPADLHRAQVDWHLTWITEYDAWRRKKGQPGCDPRDWDWPIASEIPPFPTAVSA